MRSAVYNRSSSSSDEEVVVENYSSSSSDEEVVTQGMKHFLPPDLSSFVESGESSGESQSSTSGSGSSESALVSDALRPSQNALSCTDSISPYGPPTIGGSVLGATNVFRFFSGSSAFGAVTHIPLKEICDSNGAACMVANTVLASSGISPVIMNIARALKLNHILTVLMDMLLTADPILVLLSAGTAASDTFNGVLVSSNPISQSDALWAKVYVYTAAIISFCCSFSLNLIFTLKMDALWYRKKEQTILAEELKSLSYHLIGRSAEEFSTLSRQIALKLNILGRTPDFSAMTDDEREAYLSTDLIEPIKVAFNRLPLEDKAKFINDLRKAGFPIRSTREVGFLWFMKNYSMASSVTAATAVFYGGSTAVHDIAKIGGVESNILVERSIGGCTAVVVKIALYYLLLQALFFRLCHVNDSFRNFCFIERGASMLKKIVLLTAFIDFSVWVYPSGSSFYYAVIDTCQMVYGRFFDGLPEFLVDSLSDGLMHWSAAGPWVIAYLINGLLTACNINYSSILNLMERSFASYLSRGYNPLSIFFDEAGEKVLEETRPPKPVTWRTWDVIKDGGAAVGSRMYAYVSGGSNYSDEENGSSSSLQNLAEEVVDAVLDEETPLRSGNSSNTSWCAFFCGCASAAVNAITPIIPRSARDATSRLIQLHN